MKNHVAVVLMAAAASACESHDTTRQDNLEVEVAALTFLDADSLFEAVDAFVSSSGQIWVLSKYEPFVHVFDSGARFVRAFGRYGRGPTELIVPRNFVGEIGDSNVVEIWDGGRRQIVRFTPDGNMVDHIDVPVGAGHILGEMSSASFGEFGRALRVGDGYVLDTYDKHVRVPNDVWAGTLKFIGSSGQARGSASLADPPRARPDSPIFELYQPIPLWTVCADDRVAVLDPVQNRVRWVDQNGTTVGGDTMGLDEIQITRTDIVRYVAMRAARLGRGSGQQVDTSSPTARRQIAETVAALAKQLPKRAPPVRARCDADNHLWVQQFSTESDARGYGSEWRLLEGRSKSTAVKFSQGFVPVHFGRGMIVGIHVDSLQSAKAAYTHYASHN